MDPNFAGKAGILGADLQISTEGYELSRRGKFGSSKARVIKMPCITSSRVARLDMTLVGEAREKLGSCQ